MNVELIPSVQAGHLPVGIDRVPTRGVGAMLLGGLDRRVRLR